jgi:hypothetical protein
MKCCAAGSIFPTERSKNWKLDRRWYEHNRRTIDHGRITLLDR